MKTFVALALLSSSALAYQNGTYRCPQRTPGLPQDIYVVRTIELAEGAYAPFVDAFRHVGTPPEVRQYRVWGMATVHVSPDGSEVLQIANLNLSFENGRMRGCFLE